MRLDGGVVEESHSSAPIHPIVIDVSHKAGPDRADAAWRVAGVCYIGVGFIFGTDRTACPA